MAIGRFHRRTRRYSPSGVHWRNLRIKLGMQMRKPLVDPAHQIPLRNRYRAAVRYRQRRQAQAAFLTPHPPY